MTNYDVRLSSQDRFAVDVNYEIPQKQIQYSNLILQDIASSFDGVLVDFTLYANGVEYFPLNEQQLMISVNNVLLEPVVDYQVSGSTISFTTPPGGGHNFSGIALATTADLTRNVVFLLDNGSLDIQPGNKGYLHLDMTGIVESWAVLSEQTGNIAIDIHKTSYDDFPDNFSSIVGSEFPSLINQNKNKNDSPSTWSNLIQAGDVLEFEVLSCSGISKCTVTLKLKL
jgi:hypothetical protein